MSPAVPLLLTTAIAYLVGAIPFGYLVGRARGIDILCHGSGNIGATNVGRVLGRGYGVLVFLLDFLKGAVPVVGAMFVPADGLDLPPETLPVMAAVAAFLGHLFPVYLRFRGGKGVATGAGAGAVLTPAAAAFALLGWVATLAVTRYVSLASLLACVLLCTARLALTPEPWGGEHVVVTVFCFVASALVLARHHANLRRLMSGTENRLQETPAVLLISKTLHVVALALWFGTLVFFSVVGVLLFGGFEKEATRTDDRPFAWVPQVHPYDEARPLQRDDLPEWMRKEPGTRAAGFAVAQVFPWYFGIQDVCGLLAAATALAWTASHKRRVHHWRASILLAALISVVAGGWLERRVAEKTGPRNALVDTALQEPTKDNIAKAEEARAEFGKLHGFSMLLNLATLLLVTAALVLAAQLPVATPAPPAAEAAPSVLLPSPLRGGAGGGVTPLAES